ncbi:MAG TPA: TetR family transcriptional regulator C-terminal domain-containing protein [Chryseosolibacter sp.]|nr:TetR family transcriptional regulator C-terminal domain-containing protein [Chryseosolibacter sp.]
MQTTKRKSTKKSEAAVVAPETRILLAYMNHLLLHGKRPDSVFKFALDLGIKEDDFYNYYASFEAIERQVWKGFLDKTMLRLNADESFAGFTSREKILAFYYTFFEDLKSSRSFVLLQLENQKRLELTPGFLKDFKVQFEQFVTNILNGGIESSEIAKRPYIDERYPSLFWMHLGFLLMFWRDDSSMGFEKTDAAIEKSVNVAFDLIGHGAVDSVVDFAKFMYQTRVK